MPDLTFTVEKASAVPFAVSPQIGFDLRVENLDPSEAIHAVLLRCQFQIEVSRRRYTAADQEQLRDLFGAPERWGQTLRNMLWLHESISVPAFTGSVNVSVPVPCTFDFNVAATKYFAGLSSGEIPLCLMFSGSVFYEDSNGSVQVAPISWEKEARFRLPVAVWKEVMDLYYPSSAWLCLRKDVFQKLHRYKMDHGIPTWEEAIETMIAGSIGSTEDGPGSVATRLEALRLEAASRI